MRVIVFGAGRFGKNYARELGGHLVGVVEPNPETAQKISETFNIKCYPELPEDLDFDGAVIATPPDSHIQVAKEVLKKGKYCLIEKPLGTSVEECLQLNPYKNKVMAGMIYLYHPAIIEMKKNFNQSLCNHIYTRRTNDGPVRDWQDSLWDLAAHDVYIIKYITGTSPLLVDCMKERDWAVLRMDYATFQTISYVSWKGGPKTRKIEIVYNSKPERDIFDDMQVALEISPMRLMLDDFLTGKWDSKSSFEEGLEVVNILEKASQ